MNLKNYCREHHISAKSIADACGIPYSTVNDILNAKTELERASFGVICKIADMLELGLDEFRTMFEDNKYQEKTIDCQIIVRNKRYQLVADGEKVDLCKVSELNTKNIETIASWVLRDLRTKKEISRQNDLLFDACQQTTGRD